MPWVRLDEQFARNPKVLRAGPLGIAMQVAALCYCNEYLTDGFVPRSVANTLLDFEGLAYVWNNGMTGAGEDVAASMVVKLLVEAGVWDEAPGGYLIHDYLEYQPSKADVLAQREQRSEAGRKGGLAKAKQTANEVPSKPLSKSSSKTLAKSKPVPVPDLEEAKASSRDSDEHQISRDGVWTALEDVFGKATTRTERSLRGKLTKSLIGADATYSTVKERSAAWPKLFPSRGGDPPIRLTETALEKWWGALGLIVETGKPPPPCPICDSRRIVGVTKDGEVVKADDPRAVGSERCSCVMVEATLTIRKPS